MPRQRPSLASGQTDTLVVGKVVSLAAHTVDSRQKLSLFNKSLFQYSFQEVEAFINKKKHMMLMDSSGVSKKLKMKATDLLLVLLCHRSAPSKR